MVDIRPNQLPDAILPLRETDELVVDQGTDGVRKAPPSEAVNSVAPVASQADAVAGADNVKRMTSLRTKQSIASEIGVTLASNAQGAKADSAVQSVNGKSGNAVTLVKGDIGLGNVDNTSDANKPVSTATQSALDLKANSSVTISAGTGLTGGGDLTDNRTLSLSSSTISSLAKADSAIQRADIFQYITSYDNRASMKAASISLGNISFLKEDGREGIFTLSAGTPPSDPSEGIYIVSSTTGYYWQREVSGNFVMASWWGVKGDGVTDSTVLIQNCINSNSALSGIVLPAGVVLVSGTLNISGGYLSLYGAGNGTTLRKTFASGDLFNIKDSTSGNPINSVSISGLRIDSTVESTDGAAFVIDKGDDCRLSNISIGGCFYGVRVKGGFEVRLENISVTYAPGGANGETGFVVEPSSDDVYGGNIYISNCSSRGGGASGPGTAGATIGLLVNAVDGLFVQNCYFGYFSNSCISISNTTNHYLTGITFEGVWCDHFESVAIITSGTTGTNFGDIKINGCRVHAGNSAATKGIWLAGNVSGVEVNSTFVTGTRSEECIFAQDGTSLISINGGRYSDTSGDGIRFTGVTSGGISGQSFVTSTSGQSGIRIDGGSRINITGGVIVTGFVNGVLTSGPLDNYIITGNDLQSGTTNGIVDGATGTNKSIANNI